RILQLSCDAAGRWHHPPPPTRQQAMAPDPVSGSHSVHARVAAKKIAVVIDPIGARDIPARCVDANCAGRDALAVGNLTVDAIGDETHRAEGSETAPGLRLDDSATARCLESGTGAMVVQAIGCPARCHPPLGA